MKTTGLGWDQFDVDDAAGTAQDLTDPVTNFNFATPRGVQDVTGISKSAMERLLLLADMSTQMNGVHDPGTDSAHDVFKTVPSTSVARTQSLQIGSEVLATEMLYTDYALTRNANGEFTWQVPGVLADGTVPTWTTV